MKPREIVGLVALIIIVNVGSNFLVWKLANSNIVSDTRKTEISNSMKDSGILVEKKNGAGIHQSETIKKQVHELEKKEGRTKEDFAANLSTGQLSSHKDAKPVEIVKPENPSDPEPRCLFRTIDKGEITAEINGVSKYGIHGLAATMTAWRIEPDWRMKLFEGPIDLDLSQYQFNDPPRVTRWMAGPIVGLSGDGTMYGGLVVSPEIKVFGIGGRSVSGLMGGASGGVVWTGIVFGW